MQRSWQLDGRLDELRTIERRMTEFTGAARLPAELAGVLNLVLEEWFVNLVQHGLTGQQRPRIEITLSLERNRVICHLRDNGIPFDLTHHCPPPIDDSLKKRVIGGMGIHLIRSLVDRWEYRREGNINVNRFEKRIASP